MRGEISSQFSLSLPLSNYPVFYTNFCFTRRIEKSGSTVFDQVLKSNIINLVSGVPISNLGEVREWLFEGGAQT